MVPSASLSPSWKCSSSHPPHLRSMGATRTVVPSLSLVTGQEARAATSASGGGEGDSSHDPSSADLVT